jgi:transposase
VEVITRDRANAYAEGARQGAPQALQVADRWHLLKNLSEAFERLLNRKHPLLRESAEKLRAEKAQPPISPAVASFNLDDPNQSASARHSQQRRARRYARYSEVVSLYRQGVTIRALAQQFGMHRRTVRQFVRADGFPERAKPPARPNQIDPFLPYLKRRWEEGTHNAAQLWREIQAQGFQGSDSSLRHCLAGWRSDLPWPLRRRQGTGPVPAEPPMKTPSPGQAVWLLLRDEAELEPEQGQFVETLCRLCSEIQTARALAQEFQQVVRGRRSEALGSWLEAADRSGLPELRSFAAGLRRDQQAVAAALTVQWSNGQVEGQIHRLKLVKRQAYGRAKFDLLRARFLQGA